MKSNKKQPHDQFLDHLYGQVDQHLNQAISIYQNLSKDKLSSASRTGGWSVAQCLEHLNSYAAYYHPLIESALQEYEGVPSTLIVKGWLGNYFTEMMNPDKKLVRYKAARIHQPAQALEPRHSVAMFIQHQEKLLELLSQAKNADLNNIRIPVSIARLLSMRLGDTLLFLITHNERHIRQASRNL